MHSNGVINLTQVQSVTLEEGEDGKPFYEVHFIGDPNATTSIYDFVEAAGLLNALKHFEQ